jgi:hypothetical protein
VGYSNTLGLVGGLCSIDYGFALMLTSVAVLATDGTWAPSDGVVYAVFLACVICHGILASSFSKVMGKLQTAFDATWIFATTANLTTWPTGWAFMLSWLSPIWVSDA